MEKVAGIVAEFNPFHNGHLYMVNQIRAVLGEDCPVVAVMSGDFVQRGEAAVFSKFARAEAACRCGVSLVLELPLPWCAGPAGEFAAGGAAILKELGVTHLCFGSESGDAEMISRVSKALSADGFSELLRRIIKENPEKPYPAAQSLAVEEMMGKDAAKALASPNDLLACEYLKSFPEAVPVAVKRAGAAHDSASPDEAGGIASASEIRRMLCTGDFERACLYVPAAAAEVYRREAAEGRGPVSQRKLEQAMLSRLILKSENAFLSMPGAAGGLGGRVYSAVRSGRDLEEIYSLAKTKRFTHSGIRRFVLRAALGIDSVFDGAPPYARVLACDEKGRRLLAGLRNEGCAKTVIRAKDAASCGGISSEVFDMCSSAHDFYELAYGPEAGRICGNDCRFTVIIV